MKNTWAQAWLYYKQLQAQENKYTKATNLCIFCTLQNNYILDAPISPKYNWFQDVRLLIMM